MPNRAPAIPPDLEADWRELERITELRRSTVRALDELSAQARVLVVKMLRAGVSRRLLIDRPFSNAWLSRIQREEGIRRRDRGAQKG